MARTSPKGDPEQRRRREYGRYFTPPWVVRYIVRETLLPIAEGRTADHPPRVLEPACGEGVFLCEVFRFLWGLRRGGEPPRMAADPADDFERRSASQECCPDDARQRLRLLRNSCFGVEIEPHDARTARRRLVETALGRDHPAVARETARLESNVVWGNALLDAEDFAEAAGRSPAAAPLPAAPGLAWATAFPRLQPADGGAEFDAVIGNPPYVNARVAARWLDPRERDYYRRRYRSARGAYDLYPLFLELALERLRPGGVCGMILPNKLAIADYARPCRELLLERTTLLRVVDLSAVRVFRDASVYPYIVVWRKQAPGPGHLVHTARLDSSGDLRENVAPTRVPQSRFSPAAGLILQRSLDVESRVATRRLDQLATLHSGTTGFAAEQVASQLIEANSRDVRGYPFIVSGNVDRFRIRPGKLRFMGRRFSAPVLPFDAKGISEGKRQLYGSAKIVVAGMCRRLEAAWDRQGRALGVQLYAVRSDEEPRWLLGLLNSKLLAFLYRSRNQARSLSGGYLSINKAPLGRLPIRVPDPARDSPEDAAGRTELCGLVDRLSRMAAKAAAASAAGGDGRPFSEEIRGLESRADRLVYQLYRLSEREIAEVEAGVESA